MPDDLETLESFVTAAQDLVGRLERGELDGDSLRTAVERMCRKCGGEMIAGIAMGQTVVGDPEWPNATAVTLSHGGPGKLIPCWKCQRCGWSVTR